MAYGQESDRVAFTSDADLSADGAGQYRAVRRTATGFALCGANPADFLGVLQDDPKAGENGSIKLFGPSKVTVGAAVAVNAPLTPDANGRFITATAGQRIWGRALEAAAASGHLTTANIGFQGTV